MSGYSITLGPCWACGRVFGFNHLYVPSHQGEPVCKTCMDRVNEQREAMTPPLPPHPIHPQAYEPEPA